MSSISGARKGLVGRIPVLDVQPCVEGGRVSSRAVVGEAIPVSATVFGEGHGAVNATAVLLDPAGNRVESRTMQPGLPGTDRWHAHLQPDAEGLWQLLVEGWSDPYATWLHAAQVKISEGIDVELMLAEGALVFQRWAESDGLNSAQRKTLTSVSATLNAKRGAPAQRLAAANSEEVKQLAQLVPLRDFVSPSPSYPIQVDRQRMLYGSWYEFFPRSEGARFVKSRGEWKSGTFKTAAKRLPEIAAMGFDVVYLTPIHPIGSTFRKGKNNSLVALATDPGSPYAIGSAEGGHDAIHPDLGTLADFRSFVRKAKDLNLEVVLDLALQCSPDHPWVKEHPEWFTIRADGTIAYAENPPKKYQDIYPLNFDRDPQGIYAEVLRVVLHWIDQGVSGFRVDNPHTKPVEFWQWLLAEVRERHPHVVFLSEAFTRPAMMHTLAKVGFHQSYTYFTWRNTKEELAEYFTEVSGPAGAYMRPSFWPTTHDILPPYLTHGGVAAFAIRAVLAATASPTWGIYSGYELAERTARPGVEELIDNEKYEYFPRDWSKAKDVGIVQLLTALNQIRRTHPALQQLRNLQVLPTTNDQVLAFAKTLPGQVTQSGQPQVIVVVVNLDPHQTQESLVDLHSALNGIGPQVTRAQAHDLLSGEIYDWDERPFVRLDPVVRVAHVISLTVHPTVAE